MKNTKIKDPDPNIMKADRNCNTEVSVKEKEKQTTAVRHKIVTVITDGTSKLEHLDFKHNAARQSRLHSMPFYSPESGSFFPLRAGSSWGSIPLCHSAKRKNYLCNNLNKICSLAKHHA